MLSLYDRASMIAALNQPLEPRLRELLSKRFQQFDHDDLIELTHILVIQPGDTEADIRQEVGFSPLENPIDRSRYRSRTFRPFWDWLQDHDGWWEFVLTVGNEGFAYFLYVEDADGVDSGLLSLCRTYAE